MSVGRNHTISITSYIRLTQVTAGRSGPFKGECGTEKPVELFWDLAGAVTRSGDVVGDFFVGRGRWIRRFLEEGRHVVTVDRDAG